MTVPAFAGQRLLEIDPVPRAVHVPHDFFVQAGKAILSHYSSEAIEGYLEGGLVVLTARTIVDPAHLRKELDLARKRGYAVAVDERSEGGSAIASAILDRSGAPLASLSISCRTSRFSKSVRGRYAERVVEAARSATENMR